MQTGLFTYFAHPDLFYFVGDERIYTEHIRNLCREAKNCGLPLEMNLLGIEKGRAYPTRRFWEIAAEENCSVILGCDTHDPAALRDKHSEEQAMMLVKELDLQLITALSLRPVK